MKILTAITGLTVIALCAGSVHVPQDSKGPSLNSPDCIKVPEARAELPEDEILGVGRNGEYCAYPLRMMSYHRVVNDHLGGPPILVAYDPDAAMGQVYDPVIDKKEYNFDSAGLRGGLAILKDRQTGSIWSIATGEAIEGSAKGKRMARIPSWIITWKRFSELHPDAYVLKEDSKESPHYVARVAAPTCPVPVAVTTKDKRLKPDALVFGIDAPGGSVAIPLVEHGKGGARLVGKSVVFEDAAAKAVGAYLPVVDLKELKFTHTVSGGASQFVDAQTKSVWNVEGVAIEGPMKGKSLTSVPSCRSRWFAWSAAFPKSAIIRAK